MTRPTGTPTAVTAVTPETTAVVRSTGSPQATTTVVRRPDTTTAVVRTPDTAVVRTPDTAVRTPDTTAVVPPVIAAPTPAGSLRDDGTTTLAPPSAAPTGTRGGPGPSYQRGLLAAIVALAVAVVAVVIAVLATSSGDSTPSSAPPATTARTDAPSTTVPPATSTTTTLPAQALPQGQALSSLLGQSSANRNRVQSATAAIASCGDLADARAALSAAQGARQTLLGQLAQLDLSALPQYSQLTSSLTDAWQSSSDSDAAYARWGADEQNGTCVPNDTANPDYEAALAADGQASTAKQQFTSLWNPTATSLGLPQWQPSQL